MKVLVSQSCPTLCHPMNCSPSDSSAHGILQARILEWVAISFFRGSSWPRDRTLVSCIAGWWVTGKPRQKNVLGGKGKISSQRDIVLNFLKEEMYIYDSPSIVYCWWILEGFLKSSTHSLLHEYNLFDHVYESIEILSSHSYKWIDSTFYSLWSQVWQNWFKFNSSGK